MRWCVVWCKASDCVGCFAKSSFKSIRKNVCRIECSLCCDEIIASDLLFYLSIEMMVYSADWRSTWERRQAARQVEIRVDRQKDMQSMGYYILRKINIPSYEVLYHQGYFQLTTTKHWLSANQHINYRLSFSRYFKFPQIVVP